MSEINVEVARHNMVESQIRTWEVLDQRVLDLIARAPRQDFVPAQFRNLAFADMNIPIGHGEFMMAPKVEGRLLQALDIGPKATILEVGTGTGYMTWLLASLGGHVYSVEIVPEFHADAAARLAEHGIRNVTLEVGDGARGWDKHAPYDMILVTGSLPVLPEAFQRSLAVGGRMAVIVGSPPVMEALLVERTGADTFSTRTLFETDLSPLHNAITPEKFVF